VLDPLPTLLYAANATAATATLSKMASRAARTNPRYSINTEQGTPGRGGYKRERWGREGGWKGVEVGRVIT
jgi:hypothetical protein